MIIIIPALIINLSNRFSVQSIEVEVYDNVNDQILLLELEEYLKGVVAAEMPANFEFEALKAQAVAARTYALKNLEEGQQLTTDSTIDQAWVSKAELIDRWGSLNYLLYWAKISAAVEETEGLIIKYQGELITAAYHSTSGDYTEAAVNVWGSNLPYLQSVASEYEEESPYYQYQQFFSIEEFNRKLGINSNFAQQIEILERSASGRVLKLKIGDHLFSGREFREQLGIRSTNFFIEQDDEQVRIITSGYGHGVGMSQYGADGMAANGYDFREILEHYYPDTELRYY
ncbi:stage II sporulation protein D [Natroniella sulfidigena]|uniref:stage II sporulation protein D n=1 Tax=Natroniella sulfidigena TaxID=723921 RepID=UPI00200A0573|nr:stage II sporulation protein D [Natroniella sulfidigena]MCK8816387.1 stage II sporulation protein D [Natroniella sulfidigena]